MKSILQARRECWACRAYYNLITTRSLQEHHVFQGARRQASEEAGLKVWLCAAHHTGGEGVHFDPELAAQLKDEAQGAYDALHGPGAFFARFEKNYREDDEA